MKRSNSGKNEQEWLKKFGANLLLIIKKKGYKSAYDFWVHHPGVGESISRATLNCIVNGKSDPKLTTIRFLANRLKVKVSVLTDID